jgi:cardiolipin synthase
MDGMSPSKLAHLPTEVAEYMREPGALIPGNRVQLLHSGAEAYPSMLAAISSATRTVHLEIYRLADDSTGRAFGDALIRAASRGVDTAVLYDAVGTWGTKREFLRFLMARGVHLKVFRPLWPSPLQRLLHLRDHRKLLVLDSARAFVGGMNISDEWSPAGQGWRDWMVEIEGPAVDTLERVFRSAWRHPGRERLRARTGPHPLGGEVSLAVLAARQTIHAAYLHAIARARKSVLIAAGYFVPDRALLTALRRACERGVEVSLVLPGKSDHWMVQTAGRAFYDRLLSWGVRIYEWWEAVLHAKLAVVDGVWATVGSFNLDSWSLLHNQELNVVLADPAVGRRVHEIIQGDVVRSVPILQETWSQRAWYRKLAESACYSLRRWL